MQMTDGPVDRWRKMQTGKHNKTHYNVMYTAGDTKHLTAWRQMHERSEKPEAKEQGGGHAMRKKERASERLTQRAVYEEVACWRVHGCGR